VRAFCQVAGIAVKPVWFGVQGDLPQKTSQEGALAHSRHPDLLSVTAPVVTCTFRPGLFTYLQHHCLRPLQNLFFNTLPLYFVGFSVWFFNLLLWKVSSTHLRERA